MSVVGQAGDEVVKILESVSKWGEDIIEDARSAIDNLASADYPVISYGSLTNPVINVTLKEASTMPEYPATPSQPALSPVAIPEIPSAPAVSIPTMPSLETLVVPSKPSYTNPSMANVTLGTLAKITIPDAPVVSFDAFIIPKPAPLEISAMQYAFSVDNIDIEGDSLYNAIRDRVLNNIQVGGSGLKADIENQIWNRDLERNEQQLLDSTDKVLSLWAKKGFSLPDGLLAHSVSEIQKEYENRRIDRSREIAIKQADMEQVNIFKSMEIGNQMFIGVKELLIKYRDLALRVQEDVAKFFNEYVKLQIEVNNNMVDVYKAELQAYEIEVKTKIAQVDLYRSKIEAQMANAKINDQQVALYSAQISAEIQKFSGQIEANKGLIQMFSSEVQAVLAQSGIQEAQIRAYVAQINAVTAATDIYRTQVAAIGEVAKVSSTNASINVEAVRAWAIKVGADADKYKALVEKYKAETAYNIATADVASKVAEMNTNVLVQVMRINELYNELNTKGLISKSDAMMRALEATAMISSHMAAGAMTAQSASAGISFSESDSLNSELRDGV